MTEKGSRVLDDATPAPSGSTAGRRRWLLGAAMLVTLGLGWVTGAQGWSADPSPTITITPSPVVVTVSGDAAGGAIAEGVQQVGIGVSPGRYQAIKVGPENCVGEVITQTVTDQSVISTYFTLDNATAVVDIDVAVTDAWVVSYGCWWQRVS